MERRVKAAESAAAAIAAATAGGHADARERASSETLELMDTRDWTRDWTRDSEMDTPDDDESDSDGGGVERPAAALQGTDNARQRQRTGEQEDRRGWDSERREARRDSTPKGASRRRTGMGTEREGRSRSPIERGERDAGEGSPEAPQRHQREAQDGGGEGQGPVAAVAAAAQGAAPAGAPEAAAGAREQPRRTYAAAAAAAGGRRSSREEEEAGARPGDQRGAPQGGGWRREQEQRAEQEMWEDDAFLEEFFRLLPQERDPRQRHVVRLRYRGRDPEAWDRLWVESVLLQQHLGMGTEEVLAVIVPPGYRECDVCFHTEAGYYKFWDRCRAVLREDPGILEDVSLVPLFRGEIKVLTVAFRTTAVPEEDVHLWLEQRCRVLLRPHKKVDELGFWTGEYRAIVALQREPRTGMYRHLPKYFFMGPDRGVTRYSGQPPACFHCGGFDHIRMHCRSELCSKCGVRGHPTAACHRQVTCSLCAQPGHAYRFCPQSEINRRFPEAFERDRRRAEEESRGERGHRAREEAAGWGGREPSQEREEGGGRRAAAAAAAAPTPAAASGRGEGSSEGDSDGDSDRESSSRQEEVVRNSRWRRRERRRQQRQSRQGAEGRREQEEREEETGAAPNPFALLADNREEEMEVGLTLAEGGGNKRSARKRGGEGSAVQSLEDITAGSPAEGVGASPAEAAAAAAAAGEPKGQTQEREQRKKKKWKKPRKESPGSSAGIAGVVVDGAGQRRGAEEEAEEGQGHLERETGGEGLSADVVVVEARKEHPTGLPQEQQREQEEQRGSPGSDQQSPLGQNAGADPDPGGGGAESLAPAPAAETAAAVDGSPPEASGDASKATPGARDNTCAPRGVETTDRKQREGDDGSGPLDLSRRSSSTSSREKGKGRGEKAQL